MTMHQLSIVYIFINSYLLFCAHVLYFVVNVRLELIYVYKRVIML